MYDTEFGVGTMMQGFIKPLNKMIRISTSTKGQMILLNKVYGLMWGWCKPLLDICNDMYYYLRTEIKQNTQR